MNAMPRPLYTREGDPELVIREAGWAPGPVWTLVKNLPPSTTGILFPDLPTHSDYGVPAYRARGGRSAIVLRRMS